MKNSLLGIGAFLQVPMLLMGLCCLLSDGSDWTIYPWSAVYFLANYLLIFLVLWTLIHEMEESRLFGVLVLILTVLNAVFFWFTVRDMNFLAVPCYIGFLFLFLASFSILNDPSAKWSFEWLIELYHSKLFSGFLLFSLMLCFMMNSFHRRFELFLFYLNPEEIIVNSCYVVDIQGVEGSAKITFTDKQPNTAFSSYCGKMKEIYEINGEPLNGRPLNKTLQDGDLLKISLEKPETLSGLKVSSEPVEIEVKLYRKITSFDDFIMPFEQFVSLILEQSQMEAGTIKEAYLLQNEKDTILAVHLMTETRYNLWVTLKNPHEMQCGAVTCHSVGSYFSLSDIEFSFSADVIEKWEGNQ